jgi:hypothetical protein
MRLFLPHLVLLLAALLGQLPAQAQASLQLTGQVHDGRSQRPLAYASVFLANTTFGTTTDSTGHFLLNSVPGGQYELMVSYVGYKLFTKPLNLQQAISLVANLEPLPTQLSEVVVRPAKNRAADFQLFRKQFLGSSTLSQQCSIENPQDVVVLYDKQLRELVAVAPRGLRVLNKGLGYRIIYHNFDFKVYYNTNRLEVVAAPMFEELKSADSKQQQRWQEARRRAYAGSLPHFLRSVYRNSLASEGFVVQTMVLAPNSEQTKHELAQTSDSLIDVFSPEPGVLGSVYRRPLSTAQIRRVDTDPSRITLRFPYALQVTYKNEQPDAVYAAQAAIDRRTNLLDAQQNQWMGSGVKTALGRQLYDPILEVSELRLLGPAAVILPNGYLSNPLSVRLDGYWGFEKVGEALPLDYSPDLLK